MRKEKFGFFHSCKTGVKNLLFAEGQTDLSKPFANPQVNTPQNIHHSGKKTKPQQPALKQLPPTSPQKKKKKEKFAVRRKFTFCPWCSPLKENYCLYNTGRKILSWTTMYLGFLVYSRLLCIQDELEGIVTDNYCDYWMLASPFRNYRALD